MKIQSLVHIKNTWLLLIALLVVPVTGDAQVLQDSTTIMDFGQFRRTVLLAHPMLRQAGLRAEAGESTVRAARGSFDPKLEARSDNKYYKSVDYYSITNAQIKVPTIAAVELKAGIDLNNGAYINPEDITPDDGLFYAGISVPLLQGLLIDERRSILWQAQAFQEYTQAERDAIINDLLLMAYNQYWEWWASQERVRVAEEMFDIAQIRFEAVKARAIAGDRPMIDTVEASLQAQLRAQNLREFRIAEVKNRLQLSTFLWNYSETDEYQPLLLTSGSVSQAPLSAPELRFPGDSIGFDLQNSLTEITYRHPLIRQYDAKLEGLSVEQRMKRQKLLPKLDFNYNVLSTGSLNDPEEDDLQFSTNNYKWGFTFSFPILIREARGELQLQQIKILDTRLTREQKGAELSNKARAALASIALLQDQLRIAESNLANYQQLLEAERTRFFNGESSLFLVNQREMALADAQNKVIDIRLKLAVTRNELGHALGRLN